jgi:HAE1 family hydrophobic/amphiphilic exporter-1
LLFFNRLTLNQMSFGGLALGIGLIVDSSIVVLDNIVRLRESGRELRESALTGTRQVGGAIVASTLTTSVIFLPIVFMQTISGMLFKELALVVVFALLCSLLVALTLVPMLASRYLTIGKRAERDRPSFLVRMGQWFQRLEDAYSRLLRRVLHHRVVVCVGAAALLVGALFLWPLIPVELAPETDADEVSVSLEMAQGTNIAVVNEYLHELERLVREAAPMDQVEHLTIEIRPGDAEVELALHGAGERTMDSFVIADDIRRRVAGRIPGAEIRVQAQSGLWLLRRLFGSGGEGAVQLELRGYDLTLADQLAHELKRTMDEIPGIEDVRVSRREGRPEQNLIVDREKMADLGLSVSDVAELVQTNIGGSRAGVFRDGGEEVPIVVRLQPEDRLTTLDLASASVRTGIGGVLPVSADVQTERRRSPTAIERVDGQRVTYITANLESGAALGDVIESLRGELRDFPLPPDFSLLYGGEYEEQQRAERDFTLSIIMAVVLIYMVMAAQFERFLDPLIVMTAVPLAIVGVVPTLLLTGTSLNVQSLMGLVMLIGIVVNNAIVLVDYINLLRRERGMDVAAAVLESGRLRLRPILMTASTTVLGMLPLAIGGGAGGEIQASLARAVIGGLTVSTLITLVVIPAAYTGVYGAMRRGRA